MSYAERREAILEVLCIRRHDTYRNLAFEFQVSRETIRQLSSEDGADHESMSIGNQRHY